MRDKGDLGREEAHGGQGSRCASRRMAPPTSLEQRGPSPVREKPTKRANVGKQLGLERGCNVLGEQDGTKARMEGCK